MASTAETSFVAVAVGAVSSLAEGALPSAMLLRTGTTGVTATSRSDRDGEPVVMGHVPTIDDRIEGEERATALADRAISECMENLARSLRSRDPLVHGVRRAGLALTFGPVLVAAKSSSISSPVEQAAVSRITRGPVKLELGAGAAGPETEEESIGRLKQGFGWLRSGEADILFWGAAHTDWSTARLLELEKRGMLYHLLALDAVMPGEGSAFVAWMTEERAERAGLQPLLRFAGLGTAKVNLEDPVDRLGGFARALFDATRSSDAPDLGWVLSDLSFEAKDHLEWEALIGRAGKRVVNPYVLDNPCRRIGNLGCAAIPFYAATIAASFSASYVPSPSALVLGRAPGGRRGALWLVRGSVR